MATMSNFWNKVNKTDTCWLWTGALRSKNSPYGFLRMAGKNKLSHRYAYEQIKGPIPSGLTLDHLCKNKICVNPEHLEPVTLSENVKRAAGWLKAIKVRVANKLAKTTCLKGHEYDGKNSKQRTCSICDKAKNLAAYYRRKEKKLNE